MKIRKPDTQYLYAATKFLAAVPYFLSVLLFLERERKIGTES